MGGFFTVVFPTVHGGVITSMSGLPVFTSVCGHHLLYLLRGRGGGQESSHDPNGSQDHASQGEHSYFVG
jgi:hypothetical protein